MIAHAQNFVFHEWAFPIHSFAIPERGADRPPVLRHPRISFVSQPEMFLWRNYLFFASCTAPPSSVPQVSIPFSSLPDPSMVLGDKVSTMSTCTCMDMHPIHVYSTHMFSS